jgi:hypothetical protein
MSRVLLLKHVLVLLGLVALSNVGIAFGAGSAAPVGTPAVTGPRSTNGEQPVYRFRAAHAVSFRCAFDSRTLHFCASLYSERLEPGTLRCACVRSASEGSAGSSP